MSPQKKPTFSFAHISDLHFVEELTERGRRLWLKRLETHAHGALMALARTINKIQHDERIELDALVVTGDVSTDGEEASLRTARRYIHEYEIYDDKTTPRLECYGLNMPTGWSSVVVPGNHDRYAGGLRQHRSGELEKVFGAAGYGEPVRYPYVVGVRRFRHIDPSLDPTLLFFVFDSTLPGDDIEGSVTGDRIACGYVRPVECEWLARQRQEIEKAGSVAELRGGRQVGVDYDNAIKIVVLHHHPVHETGTLSRRGVVSTVGDMMTRGEGLLDKVRRLPSNAMQAARYVTGERMTLMYNAEEFIEACYEARAHLVIFGHEHRPYDLRHARAGWTRPIDFFCCPSSAENSAKEKGFYLFKFYADGYAVEPYSYTGRRDSARVPTSFMPGTPIRRDYPDSRVFSW